MTQLILMRHGQSVLNEQGKWGGWSPAGLTPLGRAQAEAVARRLVDAGEAIAALYSSPLRRAWDTAQIIGRVLNLRLIPHEGLREINFGQVDGLSMEEFQAQFPEHFARWLDRSDMSFVWPGGERRADFFRRVRQAAEEIVASHPQETVVVVAHGGTIRAILAHFLAGEFGNWWGYTLGNCTLTRLAVDGGEARLLVLNDTAHLEGGGRAHGEATTGAG
ncbi:MAG: histidine phosphatase family protein [Anaerolineae bacterium]|nr:histidine phosphatase family protein [Anaerolineae bacterium]